MRGYCEGQAHLHAAAVVLQGSIEEAFHFGEGYDLVELPADFCGAHAEDGAAHEHIFASGELGVETGADFEKAADAAVKLGVSFGGAGDAGEDFQQRALAGAVAADQADHFAFFYVEADVFQRPDVGRAAVRIRSRSHWWIRAIPSRHWRPELRDSCRRAGEPARAERRRSRGPARCAAGLADAVALAESLHLNHGPAHHLTMHLKYAFTQDTY